jgi:hypothetical protein
LSDEKSQQPSGIAGVVWDSTTGHETRLDDDVFKTVPVFSFVSWVRLPVGGGVCSNVVCSIPGIFGRLLTGISGGSPPAELFPSSANRLLFSREPLCGPPDLPDLAVDCGFSWPLDRAPRALALKTRLYLFGLYLFIKIFDVKMKKYCFF